MIRGKVFFPCIFIAGIATVLYIATPKNEIIIKILETEEIKNIEDVKRISKQISEELTKEEIKKRIIWAAETERDGALFNHPVFHLALIFKTKINDSSYAAVDKILIPYDGTPEKYRMYTALAIYRSSIIDDKVEKKEMKGDEYLKELFTIMQGVNYLPGSWRTKFPKLKTAIEKTVDPEEYWLIMELHQGFFEEKDDEIGYFYYEQ